MIISEAIYLKHFGVRGMRWGVRRDHSPVMLSSPNGVTLSRDGSINIEKGAHIQRLVRSNQKSLPMKDMTYASLNAYDNARYIKTIGGKGFFGGGRDKILDIVATKKIKAPNVEEATRINSELMMKNEKYRKSVVDSVVFGSKVTDRDFKKIAEDSIGPTARALYISANTALTFDESFSPGVSYMQRTLREEMSSRGYQALRDENDVIGGIARAPVIIFNPESTLRVRTVTNITDDIRNSNAQQLRAYRRAGQDWVDQQLYSPIS
jgi:hypothetical protein